MGKSPNIDPLVALLVEDRPNDAALIAARLETGAESPGAVPIRLIPADSVTAACSTLRSAPIDVILLDLSRPDTRWLEALQRIRGAAPAVPVIVLAAREDEARALELLGAGAQDYVLMPPPDGPTLQRILRYARERERAVAARDRVVGIVSHELQNPLTTILTCAAALQDPEPPPLHGIRRMGDIIQRCADWTLQILRDLLDHASLDAGRLALNREPVQAATLLDSAELLFAPVAVEQSLEFEVDCVAGLPALYADAHRLLQVLSNLLGNAMKFTRAGGHVGLSAAAVGPGGGDGWDPAVVFTVSDTGAGIPPENLPHIFEWFWHSPHFGRTGAGLGLAISKGLIEAHGGKVHVRSAEGEGSTFWFTIPASGASRCDVAVVPC